MIVLHSFQGFSPPKIAGLVLRSEDRVRRVIKDYNRVGRAALYPKTSPRPEPKFTPPIRKAIVTFALSRPKDRGWRGPTSWSLDLLRETPVFEGVVESIRRERLRQIRLEESFKFQSVTTWKSSKDPKFAEKLRRLNELTNHTHNPPIVVSVDEMGPISLPPYGGHTWARSGHPDRVPATYKRLGGIRYLMGAYDYYHKRFRGYLSPSKNGAGYVRFLRWVRERYPSGRKIYLIQDHLSTHTTPAAVLEAQKLRITFVPTPTNASHLNPIETHFRTIRRWAFTGTNYTD
ncbi:MAG: IS630 family transposase [Thermoplasmata archaeon]|nr:IS630 family transposase [Thermoplasmata archaeon]